MKVFDAHCDVLWRLWSDRHLNFTTDSKLHVTYEYLNQYQGSIQCMAIYIPEEVPESRKFDVALEMVHIFYEKIVKPYDNIKVILGKEDAANLQDHEIGVILTLEGCDAIGKEITRLRAFYHLGVRSVGLTWNFGNAVADGVMELRGAGLSNFGREVVEELNRLQVWTDVSHLSVKSFWDVIEVADYPVATHSNSYRLWPNPRNLDDEQITALIEKDGMIGINFYPAFLAHEKATADDIIHHIEHICGLGGEHHVGFGSDYDGIHTVPEKLENFSKYDHLVNELLKKYSAEQVENFRFNNFVKRLR